MKKEIRNTLSLKIHQISDEDVYWGDVDHTLVQSASADLDAWAKKKFLGLSFFFSTK